MVWTRPRAGQTVCLLPQPVAIQPVGGGDGVLVAAGRARNRADRLGAAGPAYRVRPRVVFGWDADMRAPTRWSFTDPTTSVTP